MRSHTTEISNTDQDFILFFNNKNKTAVLWAKPKISKKFFEVY